MFLDFCAINHDEINRVLLVVFSSFIITDLIIVQSCTVYQNLYSTSVLYNSSMLYNSSKFQYHKVTSSNNIHFISSQVHLTIKMEPPSRTAPYLDTLFTPPVYKTCIFHQDFSSRDSLMLTIKVNTLKLSVNYD